MIQRKVIKVGKRGAMSHILHMKRDREAIADSKFELNRILNTFNVRLIASLFLSLTIYFQTSLVMHTHMIPNIQNIASEIERTTVEEVDGGINLSVSDHLIYPGDPRCFVLMSFEDYPSGSSPRLSTSGTLAQVVAPESCHMVPSNPLQQLYDLDKASPHYHQQLSDFLCGEEYGNPSSKLPSPDLASLAEYLDSVRH